MIQQPDEAQPNQHPNDFWKNLLANYWTRHRVIEPQTYHKIAEALFRMRELSGLSQAEVAQWLKISNGAYNLIEMNGGPLTQPQFDILIRLARECSLPNLSKHFENCKPLAPAKWNRKELRKEKAQPGTLEREEVGGQDSFWPHQRRGL